MSFCMRVSCGDQPLTIHGVSLQVGRRLIKGKGPMETFLLKACNWEAALRSLHTVHLERSISSPDLFRGARSKKRTPSLLSHTHSAPSSDLLGGLDIGVEPITCLQTDCADPVSPPGFLSEPPPGKSKRRMGRRRTRSSISLTAELKPNVVPVLRSAANSDARKGTADESDGKAPFSLRAPTEMGSSLDGTTAVRFGRPAESPGRETTPRALVRTLYVDDGLPRAAAVEAQRVTETAAGSPKAVTVTWSSQNEEGVATDSRAAMKSLGATKTAPDSFQAGGDSLKGRNATGEQKNGLVEVLEGLGLGHYAGALEKVSPLGVGVWMTPTQSGRFSEC